MKSVLHFLVGAVGFYCLATTAFAQEARPAILFDQSHGERFLPLDTADLGLSSLADSINRSGFSLQLSQGALTAEQLDGIAAVIVSGPFSPVSPQEIDALEAFVKRGGRLVMMLHIAPPVSGLLGRFGIMHSNGVIRETGAAVIENEPLNFKVLKLDPHPLFDGISHFSLYGGWALAPDGGAAKVVAASGEKSWVDLNGNKTFDFGDAAQPFGVVVVAPVGAGDVVVFGDDAIFQNRYLKGENLKLADNLMRYLKR